MPTETTARIQVSITVGEMAFEFTSKADWVANAEKRFVRFRRDHETMDDPMPSTICIDAKGRIVTRGLGFMRAEKDGSYPIKVYPIFERNERLVIDASQPLNTGQEVRS